MWESLVPIDPSRSAEYYERGWWRQETFLDDLWRTAKERPDANAVIAYLNGVHSRTLTYRELAATVDRFAGALIELGVAPGDVVVAHMPNWWMLTPLYLACARISAVVAPLIPPFAPRELAHALRMSAAKVCVVPDTYAGVDYAQRLREVAPETCARVVIGDAGPTGAIDFAEFFVETPWEQLHQVSALTPPRPDDVAVLVFTSGTSGQPKGVAHSFNTLYAAGRTFSDIYQLGADDIILIPHFLAHLAGSAYAVCLAVAIGGTCVMQDNMDMELLLDLVATCGVTLVFAAPVHMKGIIAVQREKPRDISTLRCLNSGSTPVPPELPGAVREVLGIRLDSNFGMTECGAITITRATDPPDWAGQSDGSPVDWTQVRIDAPPGEPAGALLTRGASQCLGYLGQREAYQACVNADGWFDTGDMARDDGRGGIRITGRRADLITRINAMKVPALEIEAVLSTHPAVTEIVYIGYPNPRQPEADLVCAVVVPDGVPPSLADLVKFLEDQQMTFEYWPDRLEVTAELPRNAQGKVMRAALRERISHQAAGEPS